MGRKFLIFLILLSSLSLTFAQDNSSNDSCQVVQYFFDGDGDGFGGDNFIEACEPSGEYSALQFGDCDDFNNNVYPGAVEVCNGFDDDCDGNVDEGGVCEGEDENFSEPFEEVPPPLPENESFVPPPINDSGFFDPRKFEGELVEQAKSKVVRTSLGDEILNYLSDLKSKADAFVSNPSSKTAYDLAFSEASFRRFLDSLRRENPSQFKESLWYAALYGPGEPRVWQDEFGEVVVSGSTLVESNGFRVEFNIWSDKFSGDVGAGVNVNWLNSAESFKSDIRKGWEDGERSARREINNAKLQQFLSGLSISDENKKLGDEVINWLDDFLSSVGGGDVYQTQYEFELLKARINGFAQSLDCDAVEEVGPYVMAYSSGDVEFLMDEFSGETLANWKNVYESDLLTVSLNWGGCYGFDSNPWMSVDLKWRGLSDSDKRLIKQARRDAQEEAEKLRKQALLIKAREEFDFTIEEINVGKEIISDLEGFLNKIKMFERGNLSAYDLHYDYILLRSKIEGLWWAYSNISENVGRYVVLYGPGVPDVWTDQFGDVEVGNGLRVYSNRSGLSFAFSSWYDDFRGLSVFDVQLSWGKLSREYRDEIRRAERDGWLDAEKQRRSSLALKLRNDLLSEGVKDKFSDKIKTFIGLVHKYESGEVSAFDVELVRLRVSHLLKNVSDDERRLILVLDLGDQTPPPEVWYNFESGDIELGGFRSLVERVVKTKRGSFPRMVAGLSSWCEEPEFVNRELFGVGECNTELIVDWLFLANNSQDVFKELKRAHEVFWREVKEEELRPVIDRLVSKESGLSSSDRDKVRELLSVFGKAESLINKSKSLSVGEFQYQTLLLGEEANNILLGVSDPSTVIVALAKEKGFHEYDDVNEELRGVTLRVGSDFDFIISAREKFTPFFLEDENNNSVRELEFNIFWKNLTPEMMDELKNAYERFEVKVSKDKLRKLLSERSSVIPSQREVQELVDKYENGSISAVELRKKINGFYFKLQAYDSEIAYLASVANESLPVLDKLNINYETEHVKVKLYESDFTYRFGTSFKKSVGKVFGKVSEAFDNLKFSDEVVNMSVRSVSVTGRQVSVGEPINPENGFGGPSDMVFPGEPGNPQEIGVKKEGNGGGFAGEEFLDEEVLRDIENSKKEFSQFRQESFSDLKRFVEDVSGGGELFRRWIVIGSGRIIVDGVRPRLSLSVSLTDAEIARIAEILREKFEKAKEEGLLDDAVYELNLQIDNYPALQEAVRRWGNTTTSLKLTYKGSSLFELNFRTEDGSISWVEYGVSEGAGNSSSDILIQVDFESLMKLRNWWEGRLKNAEGLGDVIVAVPGFVKEVGGMIMRGEIVVKPFSAVTKISQFLQLFFEVMVQTSGVTI